MKEFNKGKMDNYNKGKRRIGMTKKMNNGLYATITSYFDAHEINVVFENGYLVAGTTLFQFQHGTVGIDRVAMKLEGKNYDRAMRIREEAMKNYKPLPEDLKYL